MQFQVIAALLGLTASAAAYSADATYYYQEGRAGSCGVKHSDDAKIVALSAALNPRSKCGDKIKVTRGSKSVTVTVADTCGACKDTSRIDLSVGAFKALGTLSEGKIKVTWSYL